MTTKLMVPKKLTPSPLRTAQREQPDTPGKCNARKPNGWKCQLPAGYQTDHTGSGKCWIHDDPDRADTIYRYRGIKQKTIKSRLRQMHTVERDVLNLVPDVQLVRAMVIDYVERYEELAEAILHWYKTGKQRPPAPPDLGEAIKALETVSRMVERVHRIQSTGAIGIDTFRRILEQMGIIVARHVSDGRALEAIESEWSAVVVDTRTQSARALPDAVQTREAPTPAALADPSAPPVGAPKLSMRQPRKKKGDE